MEEYQREYPLFALCGLNCGLCPRHQTKGGSKCPGCGGPDFHLKHPACAVITCSRKHGGVEFCFQCTEYPCKRYAMPSNADSFITYRNVLADMETAKTVGIATYTAELDGKVAILERLIKDHNDGRRKAFYCLGVNLLPMEDLEDIMQSIKALDGSSLGVKERVPSIAALFEQKAKKRKVRLELRK